MHCIHSHTFKLQERKYLNELKLWNLRISILCNYISETASQPASWKLSRFHLNLLHWRKPSISKFEWTCHLVPRIATFCQCSARWKHSGPVSSVRNGPHFCFLHFECFVCRFSYESHFPAIAKQSYVVICFRSPFFHSNKLTVSSSIESPAVCSTIAIIILSIIFWKISLCVALASIHECV